MTGAEVFVDIPSGSGPARIGERLVEAGVVRDPTIFRAALLVSGRARALKAGEYRFTEPMHALDVIDKIARGDVYKRLLTFREGLTIAEMAQVFEERGFGKAAEFQHGGAEREVDRRSRSRRARSRRVPVSRNLLAAARHAGRGGRRADGRRDSGTRCHRRCAAPPKADGLSVRQLVTLASLVEKETGARRRTAAGRRRLSQSPEDPACRCRPIPP